jgi:hypothetical protein
VVVSPNGFGAAPVRSPRVAWSSNPEVIHGFGSQSVPSPCKAFVLEALGVGGVEAVEGQAAGAQETGIGIAARAPLSPAPDPPSPGLVSADGSPVLPVPCVSVTHPFHQSAVFQPCEIRSENVTLTKHGFKSRRIAPILLTDQRARGPRARSRARRFCRVARHWDGSGERIPVRDPAAHDFSASNARARYRWCRRATLGTSGPGTLRPRGAEQGARPFASAPGASMCWWATVETLMLIQRHLP